MLVNHFLCKSLDHGAGRDKRKDKLKLLFNSGKNSTLSLTERVWYVVTKWLFFEAHRSHIQSGNS